MITSTLKATTLAVSLAIASSPLMAGQTSYSLPAQPLAKALSQLAVKSNVQIFAKAEILKNLNTRPIRNAESAREAIRQLLRHTELEAQWLTDSAVIIKPKQKPVKAETIAVKENNVLNNPHIERISVYGRHNQLIMSSGTATKSNMDLMETPAAVVVVDKVLLDQQASATLQESIRNVSGLSQAGNNYGIGDNLIIRGLGANYVYDGMYAGAGLSNSYNPTRSLTNIESIEVLKGPATGLYGTGAAGGVINLIEKKPLDVEKTQLKAVLGQWQHHSVMLDTTAPINDDTAYRIVANYDSSDGYRDLGSKRNEIYTSLRHRVNENNEFVLSMAYIDDENQVDSVGHPVRIINHDSINDTDGTIGWQDLVNDFDGDEDGVLGLQLTDEQRQALANSIESGDGHSPYDLGSQGLISPLSEPNQGEELRIKLRHDWTINSDTTLTQQLQYRDYDSEFVRQTGAYNYVYWNRSGEINANPRAPLVIDDVLYPYAARRQEYRRQITSEQGWQYFADLQMEWSTDSIEGEHLFSVNYENRDMSLKSWSAYDADGSSGDNPLPYILDIRNPNWPTGKFTDYDNVLRSNYDKEISAWGVNLQEVVYFDNKLTGRAGIAYSGIEQTYQHKGTDRSPLATPEQDTDDAGLTYNFGLNYRFSDNIASFVNYAQGRTAYSILGSIAAEDNRPDSESKSFDIGMRFTAFDEDLLGSLVWFETRRTNLRYNNPDYNDNPEDEEYNVSVPQYYYDDEDNSKGVELDLNMAFNDQWSMNLNATYQDAITIRQREKSGQTKGVPKVFASLWAHYAHQFNGLSQPLNFSLGVTYEDERTINSTSFGLPDSKVDSYVMWDAGVSYQLDNWDIQLNLRNLTDETYYIKPLFLGGLPGESRNAQLTVKYNF